MSVKLVFDDGTEVQISKETEENLRKEFSKKEPDWIAAVTPEAGGRIILNVKKLSSYAKKFINDEDTLWISIDKYGNIGIERKETGAYNHIPESGLNYYKNTKIIF